MAYPYKKQKLFSDEPKKKTLHTKVLTDAQAEKLEAWLDKHLWAPYKVDYAKFAYKSRDVNVVVYTSGKLVVQGKGTEDFVAFVLEPEITGAFEMGYDEVLHPEWYELHVGIDESGIYYHEAHRTRQRIRQAVDTVDEYEHPVGHTYVYELARRFLGKMRKTEKNECNGYDCNNEDI